MVKNKVQTKQKYELRARILDFAQKHGFVINATGYDYYVEGFLQFNHCPCDSERKACPCTEAVQEIEDKGHCLCHLFWRDYKTFKADRIEV